MVGGGIADADRVARGADPASGWRVAYELEGVVLPVLAPSSGPRESMWYSRELPGVGVPGPVAEPAGAAGRVGAFPPVGRPPETPVDVHEDMDAGVVIERDAVRSTGRPRRDQSPASR